MSFPPRAIRKPRIVFPPVDINVVSEQIVLAMLTVSTPTPSTLSV